MHHLPYADLHIHSNHSDGSLTPGEIVAAALENGVGLMAIADHNLIEGSLEAAQMCEANGIRLIPAVELDTYSDGDYHILGYGFDAHDSEFRQFIRHVRFSLDEQSVRLIGEMERDYPKLSLNDFMAYPYKNTMGGWKGLYYLMDRGVTGQLKEGLRFYEQYGVTWDRAGFSSVAATAYRIRLAGGRAVLAHPGVVIDTADINLFIAQVERLVEMGLDGVECYYPSHTEEVTRALVEFCQARDLMITSGSDCHGAFGSTRVGEMKMPIEKLNLKGIG